MVLDLCCLINCCLYIHISISQWAYRCSLTVYMYAGMSDELHVDTHMTSLVQDLLSPLSNDLTPRGRATNDVIDSLLDSPPPVPSPSSSRSSHRSKEGGSRILNMLQNAAANSAASSGKYSLCSCVTFCYPVVHNI